jgi:hypothetical protein
MLTRPPRRTRSTFLTQSDVLPRARLVDLCSSFQLGTSGNKAVLKEQLQKFSAEPKAMGWVSADRLPPPPLPPTMLARRS